MGYVRPKRAKRPANRPKWPSHSFRRRVWATRFFEIHDLDAFEEHFFNGLLNVGPQDWPKMWFGHPDQSIDIAICPLVPLVEFVKQQHGVDLFFRCVDTGMIPTDAQLKELDALEPVTFIGYPNGVWDSKNLLPVARRGTTASPIEVDFEGTPRFIIDASVFGGSSGSPVFILNQGSWATKQGGLVAGSRFYFVGVIAAVFFRTHLNQIIPVPAYSTRWRTRLLISAQS